MVSLTGKKIFVLYPDVHLREVFYGHLRNTFTVYYMYDYEKVKSLVQYYPGSIIVLNLVDNDLQWLPEELHRLLEELSEDVKPAVICIYDNKKPLYEHCRRSVHFQGNRNDLRDELNAVFVEFGGKGRRNFVRYGGSGEDVAALRIVSETEEFQAIAHDISASGLSCSLSLPGKLPKGERLRVSMSLENGNAELTAEKILERRFGENTVHVLKFIEPMIKKQKADLLHFIYSSLDAKMDDFIKKLSN